MIGGLNMNHCPLCGDAVVVKDSHALVTGRIGYRCIACGWKKIIK